VILLYGSLSVSLPPISLIGILVFLCIFFLVTDYLKNRKPTNFPPGPRAMPLVGNLFDMDAKLPHMYLHHKVRRCLPFQELFIS
uniref:Uncharacterized protein n=1 Tax=Oncorhynchus mykiss TaxID=8022 RepID=A0A8C7QRH3_ONCMY